MGRGVGPGSEKPLVAAVVKKQGRGEMRKAVLHAEGRICKHPGCNVTLSIYNPGKTCSVHPEVLTVKEARRALIVDSTDKEKARMRRYKARVRAGVVIPKKRVVIGVPFPEVASREMNKAIARSLRKTATASDIERATRGGKP